MRSRWILAAAALAALATLAILTLPARAGDRLSGGLSLGPAIVQYDTGAYLAGVPRVWAGYSATDLLTAAAGLDLEISSRRPVYLGWAGGRINLERSADWRLAAGLEGTHAFGPGEEQAIDRTSWRAVLVGTRILSRGSDGRPLW
jgi:hypothetical protein